MLLLIAVASVLARNARANLIQDPNFTSITYTGTTTGLTTLFGQFGSAGGQLTVANWSTSGYNFVFAPDTVDGATTADSGTKNGANANQPNEAPGAYNTSAGYGDTYMYGSNNGGVDAIGNIPGGGNFVAGDGAFEIGAISQKITGLTAGQTYVLKFEWAAGQQQSFSGTTSESWTITLGTESHSTSTYYLAANGFSGWMSGTMYFTPASTSDTLSFLAVGSPSGQPPFSLIGDLDLEVIPDVSNWMIFAGFGALCIGFETLRRRRRQAGLADIPA